MNNAPNVILWVGEMTKFGLSDLMKSTVDSKFDKTLTVKLEFHGLLMGQW